MGRHATHPREVNGRALDVSQHATIQLHSPMMLFSCWVYLHATALQRLKHFLVRYLAAVLLREGQRYVLPTRRCNKVAHDRLVLDVLPCLVDIAIAGQPTARAGLHYSHEEREKVPAEEPQYLRVAQAPLQCV